MAPPSTRRRAQPGRLVEAGRHAKPWPIPGVWTLDAGVAGEIVVVVPHKLPIMPGTSLLRQLFESHNKAELVRRFAHIVTDDNLPWQLRADFYRGIEMNQIPTNPTEQKVSLLETYERAMAEGIAKGVERSRAAILEMAAYVVPEAQMAELRAIRDPDVLTARVRELMAAR